MPSRWAAARHPLVYEIDTWPWLAEIGASEGRSVNLATVPERHWDAIAEMGFDAVWLMGVWARSPAGIAAALADPSLVESFRAALPDWQPSDVVGSAYCVRSYDVDEHIGGRRGLAAARSALAERGLGLLLDFVPNHVAMDHPWTTAHPEFFVAGSPAELLAEPQSFVDVAGRVLANGRDPYFPAWRDVLQLNAFAPALRAAAAATLTDIADQCDGVRCDMAMLMMNDVFARTWGPRVGDPPDTEFWPEAIAAVRRRHPAFTFVAEAYWDMEEPLQRQGFDFCYDKRLYDRLVDGDAAAVGDHLSADTSFQDRLLRFVENHDEARAAAIFDPARLEAVTVATLTQAGARLVHRGQLEGRTTHVPVFLGRAPREAVDSRVASFHRALLVILADDTFRSGSWSRCEVTGAGLLGWGWDTPRRWLIVVNLSASTASARVRVPWPDVLGRAHRLTDASSGIARIHPGDELRDGWPVTLGSWQWRILAVEEVASAR